MLSKNRFVFLCLLIALFSNCSPSKITYQDNAETIFKDQPAPGVITVSTVGFGKEIGSAETDAIERAFKNIMFQGIPSYTGLKDPMVNDRTAVEAKQPNLFTDFFKNNTYEQFITGQSDPTVTAEYKRPKSYRVSKSLSINYHQLRKHLEKIGGTKKFGY